jgi:hypothetical protein
MNQLNRHGLAALAALFNVPPRMGYEGNVARALLNEDPEDLETFAQPYMGNDYLGNDYLGSELMGTELMGLDYMGAEGLMGADSNALLNLLGAEGMALLGRDPRRRRAVANAVAAATGAKAGIQAVPREGYLPIPTTLLPALAPTQNINIFPQAQGGIQLTRLVIPSNQGTRYIVNDVVVATRSQFFSPGAISAVGCSEVQTIRLRGDVAYPGTIVSVSITNVSGVDQTLLGAFFVAEAREARTV